jgi:hypothetical protein
MKRASAVLSLVAACATASAIAQDNDFAKGHAVDLLNCVNGISTVNGGDPYRPALAALNRNGVDYVAASTSKPSDSFPGLISIVTGGSPALTGIYYDVSYARNLDAPAKTTGNGLAAGPCTPGAAPTGTTSEYEEGIDIAQTKVNGGAPGAALTDGGIASIDPKKLIRDPNKGCSPVYPWNFCARQHPSAPFTALVATRLHAAINSNRRLTTLTPRPSVMTEQASLLTHSGPLN